MIWFFAMVVLVQSILIWTVLKMYVKLWKETVSLNKTISELYTQLRANAHPMFRHEIEND